MNHNKRLIVLMLFVGVFVSGSGCAPTGEYPDGHRRPGSRLRERLQERRLARTEPSSTTQQTPGLGDQWFSINHGGLSRQYLVHVPSVYTGSSLTPVVFAIHGGGGSAEQLKRSIYMDAASEKHGFLAVYPEGTGRVIQGKKKHTWNTITCCGSAVENNVDDVGFFSKMIQDLKLNFNVDENRIYATGISNGAMMSHRLACELSDQIAAVAPIAGPMSPEIEQMCKPSRPVSVLNIHGKKDPCAAYYGGENCGGCLAKAMDTSSGQANRPCQPVEQATQKWAERNHCPSQPHVTFQKGDVICMAYGPCDQGSEVTLCSSEVAGHTWPSERERPGKYQQIFGNATYNFSNNEIWEFFKKHPKS